MLLIVYMPHTHTLIKCIHMQFLQKEKDFLTKKGIWCNMQQTKHVNKFYCCRS